MTIEVVEYDPAWPGRAAAAIAELFEALCGVVTEIEHIGSTAVPGLAAKPIIDLMAAAPDLDAVAGREGELAAKGFRRHENGMTDRLLYIKGNLHIKGNRTHNLHVVAADTWPTRNQRILRDYLRAHPREADRYAALKWAIVASHRAGYAKAKTALIQEMTDQARAALGLPSVPVWEKGPS